MKSGNLNFLEPSGTLQACNGTALPLPLPFLYLPINSVIRDVHLMALAYRNYHRPVFCVMVFQSFTTKARNHSHVFTHSAETSQCKYPNIWRKIYLHIPIKLTRFLLGALAQFWKSEYQVHHVSPSVRPQGTNRIPLDVYSLNLTFDYFSRILLKCGKNNGYFIWGPIYIYNHISLISSYNRNFQTNTVKKNTFYFQ
jgi:hypothetical protein